MENVKCANCGKEIRNPNLAVHRNNQTYCSEVCADRAQKT